MRNVRISRLTFLLILLPLLVKAQSGVAFLVAPISKITTTKFLMSIGVEVKLPVNASLSVEYSLPIDDYYEKATNKKVFSYSAEIRKYNPITITHKKQTFFAFQLGYRNETFALKNKIFYTESGEEILYNYAETNAIINSLSIKWGIQKIFKSKFIVEFSLGLGINKKTVRFDNVIEAPAGSGLFSFLDFSVNFNLGSLGPKDSKVTPPHDNQEGSRAYLNLPLSVRFGFLFDYKK